MKEAVKKYLRETLGENHVCYVLITCEVPSDTGEMQVDMTYEGDPALAAYLLQGAQAFIEDQESCREEQHAFSNKKIITSFLDDNSF